MLRVMLSALLSSPVFPWLLAWVGVSLLALLIHLLAPTHPRVAAFGAALGSVGIDLPKLGAALVQIINGKASPGLAGVLVDVEKIVGALEADPQLVAGVTAKQAAKRPVSVPGLMVLALFFGAAIFTPTLTGCGASLSTIASDATLAVPEAEALLGYVESDVNAYFAANPNPAEQANADKAISAAELALDAGVRALQGVTNASQAQITAAFTAFAQAWADLEQILADYGIFQSATTTPATPAAKAARAKARDGGRPVFPTPILLKGLKVTAAAAKGGAK